MPGVFIKYQKNETDNLFFDKLKKEVRNYFRENKRKDYGNYFIALKTVFLFLLFFGSYGLTISNQFSPNLTLLSGIICGLSSVLIVFNISHDASHNCLFRSRALNKFLTYSFYLVGGNAYVWDITHNKIHHTYPNVADTDPDIYQAAPFIRVSPGDPFQSYHRYQHLYAPFLYLTHSFYLIFIKDFQDLHLFPQKAYSIKGYKHSLSNYIILCLTKLFYIFYSLVLPLIILDIAWWKIVLAYLLIQVLMSFLLSVVLIPVHMIEGNGFPSPRPDLTIQNSWTRSIFENTIDYSCKSRLANFFFGGLNTHLAHHLFPYICHVHLIAITQIIKNEAQKHGMPYRDMSMWEAIKAHFRLLKKMSLPVSK
jgi:linoleoyl-CoA desaturase